MASGTQPPLINSGAFDPNAKPTYAYPLGTIDPVTFQTRPTLPLVEQVHGSGTMTHEEAHAISDDWYLASVFVVRHGQRQPTNEYHVTFNGTTRMCTEHTPTSALTNNVISNDMFVDLLTHFKATIHPHEDSFLRLQGKTVWKAYVEHKGSAVVGYDVDPIKALIRAVVQLKR